MDALRRGARRPLENPPGQAVPALPLLAKLLPPPAAHWVVWVGYAYIGVAVLLLCLEDRFLFHPLSAGKRLAPASEGLVVEDVVLDGGDGLALHGWWSKPEGWQPSNGAVLYLHGKGGNLSSRGKAMGRWRDTLRLAVLIIDYPGYGKSDGTPTEASCYAAGDAAYDWLTQTIGVPGRQSSFLAAPWVEESLPSWPHTIRIAHLVLIATFTSFPDMAQKTFPWLPGHWLVHNQLDNLAQDRNPQDACFHRPWDLRYTNSFLPGQAFVCRGQSAQRFFPMPGAARRSPFR